MSDTWTGVEPIADDARRVSTGKRRILNLVEENLRSEVNRRRGRLPHAQLRVDAAATTVAIESAFARLAREYAPQSFEPYGDEATALAEEIVEMLADARERLLLERRQAQKKPGPSPVWAERGDRSEATLRALETVRAAIARHRVEAARHRDAGRLPEAIASLEAILRLDRHDTFARKLLPRVREALEPRPWWERLIPGWFQTH